MAEEHHCQKAPEGHRLCANNCGFFGSPTTMNLCSKCFIDIQSNEQEQAKTKSKSTIQSALYSAAVDSIPQSPVLNSPEIEPSGSVSASVIASVPGPGPVVLPVQSNRCEKCRKRVGLTGFKCRCGITFCGAHRYPEKHGCGFDYKAVGARGNSASESSRQSSEARQDLISAVPFFLSLIRTVYRDDDHEMCKNLCYDLLTLEMLNLNKSCTHVNVV